MRPGMSHRGKSIRSAPSVACPGIKNSATTSTTIMTTNSASTGRTATSRTAVAAAKARVAAASETPHPCRWAVQAYARQKAACEAVPAMTPAAALAAKRGPWSSARNKTIGPDVKGIPISHPPTADPHRRPARLAAQSHAVRLGNPGQGVRGGGIALTAVIQRAVWLHIGEWNDGRQPGDLERDQRFDLVPRKGSLDPTEARPIVVAGVGANLHSELATPPCGRDRDRQGPRVDAAGNVGAVDASQDRLVFTGAFADVGVEIQESGLSVWYGRGGVGWRAPVPA